MQNVLYQSGHFHADGGAGRKSRRFDARTVHKPGGCFLNEKLVAQFVGPQSRKAGNGLPQGQVLYCQSGLGAHLVQLGGSGGGIFFVVNVGGRGADEQIAVHGGGHQHALAVLARQLKDRVVYVFARCMVQQKVVAPPRHNGHGVGADLVVQFVGMHPCRVDDTARFQRTAVGPKAPAAVYALDALYLGVKLELHTVFGGVFGKGVGQAEGADDAASGRPQRRHRFVGDVRLQGAQFLPPDDAQSLHAVGAAVFQQFFQRRAVLLAQADHQAAALPVGKIQLFGKVRHHPAARHVEGGHPAAGGGVKPCMDNGAVGLGGAAADVLLLIDHQNVALVSAQFPGRCAARHPTADDDDIHHTSSSSSRAQP